MSQSKLKTTRTKGALNNWLILLVRKINEKYWLLTRWGALKYLLLAHIRKMTSNMSFKWLFHSPGKCSDFIIDNLKKLKNTCKSLCTYPITFRSYTFWNTRLATLTLFRREEKNVVTVEPQYNEGLRDWQNMFPLRKVCCIKVLFQIFYCY